MTDATPVPARLIEDPPIYVVSKGRARYPYTIRTLSLMRTRFYVVVEAPEVDDYRAAIHAHGGWGTVLTLDPGYKSSYDALMPLADTDSRGPGPARNFAWDHAAANGANRHWVMDDNISEFRIYTDGRKRWAADRTPLRLMEDFQARYTNLVMCGPNYEHFINARERHTPFVMNTRIYSCNLIATDLAHPHRWRGRYNEDTILSLDLLTAGWATVQFNLSLQKKLGTQSLPGGNTDEFYHREGKMDPAATKSEIRRGLRRAAGGTDFKSRMLVAEYPQYARLVRRFQRLHHLVDYSSFTTALKLRPDARPIRAPILAERPRAKTPLRPNPSGATR
jgi:hypothetical protein